MLCAEPPPPVRRGHVADVGDAGVDRAALEDELRRRHPPASQGQFTAISAVPDDGRGIVREDARHGREVARSVPENAGELDDGLLALGQGVEVTHALAPGRDSPS